MDAARKFVDKGQIDKAVKEYLRIVHEDPKDVRVWLKIGDLYAKKGSKQDAIETYLKVARFYHEQGFFLKAVAVYKQILKLDSRLVDVILKLAELYRQLGLMSDAMQHFESVAAHFHREGNTKEALATVKKLVDLDPENIATRIKLAELYSKEGLVEDAANEFSVACDQLRRQGRQDDFVKVAERLLWHKPDNHGLNRELAGLYLRRNDPRRALQKLQACFKADPRDVDTLGLLAQAFQALDQKAKTVSVLKELARIHLENKHRDKAADVFRKILEFVPTDADAKEFLGPAAVAAVAPKLPPAPPPAATMAPPPSPPHRIPTPLPAQLRAAGNANFGITSDLPSLASASAKMTGSMPLIDEGSLSGVDFALPEYDDADFSADMEPAPDPRAMSAAGERHAEEISKILAETDVYVKYGLHQKAVDHLRRVFGLDPENVEAHERLKDIFISQGREQEAEVELLKLAELVASSDPDRAEQYLQELLAINGTHTGAFEVARRFRLRVARSGSVSSEVSYSMGEGGVAPLDVELDDLDLAPPQHFAQPLGRSKRDSVDDFDPDDLIGNRVAHGSPAPGRPPAPPRALQDDYDPEFDPGLSHSTQQTSTANVHRGMDDELDDGVIIDSPPPRWDDHGGPTRFDAHANTRARLHGDAEQGVEHVPADGEDLPFDPEEARRFDAAVHHPLDTSGSAERHTDAVDLVGFEEPHRPHPSVNDTASYEAEDPLSVSGSYDPYGTEAVQTPPYEPTASHDAAPDFGGDEAEVASPPRAESSVEDELDEADFYSGQGMYADAIDVLRSLLDRYPGHRLATAKLQEISVIAGGHDRAIEPLLDAVEETGGTDAIDLDDIEEVAADDFEELHDSVVVPVVGAKKRQPSVMLERPLDEGDAETHYDLGLAYKEMGLLDEAIKAFEKTLRARGREVQCRVMIGMCQREMNNSSEAIHQFKQGLHAEPSERERQSLYYEIGITYETIGDHGEALYYFEMVTKRDPGFADAGNRAAELRARGARGAHSAQDDDV
ncbi:MAG: tetratricopeptide repeat protein [Myxococcota bacterium]|nr:tetratricopeptide repeat protein [Myxococcota bacterium]